ncbi:MAG: UDP-N-acetylmuramate dehydrogenase [Defluviitaleaceae bacterium]|nr:UDP-N-acetylmuramate dehydrogenase [Defluviitaleaceae bacterium]
MAISYQLLVINKLGKHNVLLNEPMSKHTSFKIGGIADVFVMPQSTEQLRDVLDICRKNDVPYFVLGNGSNLLVCDGGIRGVVISLLGLNDVSVSGEVIHCGAGVSMKEVAEFALEHCIAGLEFAHGIPGSVGGGVFMNAGAYEGEMSQVFVSAKCIDQNNQIIEVSFDDMDFSYRKSFAQKEGLVIASVILKGSKGNKEEIADKMAELLKKREEKQPLEMPSAGSIFKRPEGNFAGKLISDAGLRGFSIGGAQVSEKHCGFIINKGNATAADVFALIGHIQQTIKEKFGMALETEIKVAGDE